MALVNVKGEKLGAAPRVKGCKPTGSLVLVEHLTSQEQLATNIQVSDKVSVGCPQAYVLAVGPSFNPETYGFKAGDRVLIQGNFNPVPKFGKSDRDKAIIEPHSVRAVLEEEAR